MPGLNIPIRARVPRRLTSPDCGSSPGVLAVYNLMRGGESLAQELASATGRRKTSTAHVQVFSGSGNITVNGKPVLEYLKRETLVMIVEQPLQVTESVGGYDIVASSRGGGRDRHPGRHRD